MKPFNNQFATQKLRENANDPKVKLYIHNTDIYTAIMDKFMRPNRTLDKMPISDEGEYLETDLNTFDKIKEFILKNFEEGLDYDYEIESDYMKRRQDPSYGQDVIDYSGTQIEEESNVTGGEAYLPGLNVPEKKYKGKEESKERGTGKGYIFKDFWEEQNIDEDTENDKWTNKTVKIVKGRHAGNSGEVIGAGNGEVDIKITSNPKNPVVTVKQDEVKITGELNENYSRFRNETKTRTKEQQFHTAVRLAEKKILEANKILEYTAQLKGELNEVRVGKHTQKLMERITRGIAEAYGKMKKLK